MDKRFFSKKLVEWYLENKRALPWRDTTDPYKVWLSEIILQQTRVNQGLPYYEKFVTRYPNVKDLAAASEDEVLRCWQGLGYYSRARNLHKCAKTIVDNGSTFPSTFEELKSLPGIGDYTAAAIASFSFNQAVAVVDGNVFRVLARVFGIQTPIDSPTGKKEFISMANELIDASRPDLHNQAIMEFGALHCTPVNPSCGDCIFKKTCVAKRQEMQSSLPVKEKNVKGRKRYFHYIVYRRDGKLLMKKRSEKDIWLGLYDFPVIESPKPLSLKRIFSAHRDNYLLPDASLATVSETYRHMLTHQTIYSRFILIEAPKKLKIDAPSAAFYSFSEISELPKPNLISRFLADFAFHH